LSALPNHSALRRLALSSDMMLGSPFRFAPV